MICHPTANFLGHYALPGLAARGVTAIGLLTRYVGNDTSLVMENCLLDIGSKVAHLRSIGYEKIVLIGNSGGASIAPYYQAESPSVTVPTTVAFQASSRRATADAGDDVESNASTSDGHSARAQERHLLAISPLDQPLESPLPSSCSTRPPAMCTSSRA
jgi:hypothetical protein